MRALFLFLGFWMLAPASRADEIVFDLIETAGLKRFGYPVDVTIPLPKPVDAKWGYRLEAAGPLSAQIRPVVIDGMVQSVMIDFSVSMNPLEKKRMRLVYGPDVVTTEPKGEMRVETAATHFRVLNHGNLTWSIPKDALGLFDEVKTQKTSYVRPKSEGLTIWYRDQIPFRAGGVGPNGKATVGTILRQGPHAVALRFTGTEALRGNRSVESTLELTFPRSKSWVRIDWSVDDPNSLVAGLGVDLNMNLTAENTLVDLGAGSYVYTTLKKTESVLLDAQQKKWQILQGTGANLTPLATSTPATSVPEGWAHIMDRQICAAFALHGMTDSSGASIRATGEGQIAGMRYFSRDPAMPPPGIKKLTAWFHFVPMPVQIGALTSPQSMMAPLEIRFVP